MIDLELLRKNPEIIKAEIKKRNIKIDVSLGLKLDEKRRDLIVKVDKLRTEKNKASKMIPELKGTDKENKILQMKKVNGGLKELEKELSSTEDEFSKHMSCYPNISHSSTPAGKDEHDNVVLHHVG